MAKIELTCINSKLALRMVKNTALLVCHSIENRDSKEEVVINEQKLSKKNLTMWTCQWLTKMREL
jgi:hypothetical protein